MKIDYAIMASDSNPDYLDFWEPVSKVWNIKMGITPILIHIGDGDNIDITYGDVINMKPIEGIPLHLQAQWVRFWYMSTLGDKVGVISDIDMFALSRKYFVDKIEI